MVNSNALGSLRTTTKQTKNVFLSNLLFVIRLGCFKRTSQCFWKKENVSKRLTPYTIRMYAQQRYICLNNLHEKQNFFQTLDLQLFIVLHLRFLFGPLEKRVNIRALQNVL